MRHYVHAWLYRAYTLRETEHVVNPVHSKLQVPDGPPHASQLKTTAYGRPWAVFFWGHQRTMDFGESFGGFSLSNQPDRQKKTPPKQGSHLWTVDVFVDQVISSAWGIGHSVPT
jgi:hypothetical protein